MARIGFTIEAKVIGQDHLAETFQSIGEALSNAYVDNFDISLHYCAELDAIIANGVAITSTFMIVCGLNCTITIKPTASMVLFISQVMILLPARARVTWVDGWPIIYCPPHDDREAEDGQTPLVPGQLEPA